MAIQMSELRPGGEWAAGVELPTAVRRVAWLELSPEQREALESTATQGAARPRAARQAQALLMAAEGRPAAQIARACRTTPETVRRWRKAFEAAGPSMLGVIAPGRGRKPSLPREIIEQIVHDTLHSAPDDGGTWSTRTMARRYGVSKDTVARIWRERDLTPGRPRRD